tara:strand:+ start:128 stop:550 length:423 start_codon:yes stop_codon:yes gene_type:complete
MKVIWESRYNTKTVKDAAYEAIEYLRSVYNHPSFVVEHEGKRYRVKLEQPEHAMVRLERLRLPGWVMDALDELWEDLRASGGSWENREDVKRLWLRMRMPYNLLGIPTITNKCGVITGFANTVGVKEWEVIDAWTEARRD